MNPDEKVKELVETIKNSDVVLEYQKLKEELYQDDECKDMIKEFKDKTSELQSLMMNGQEAEQEKLEKLQNLYKILVSNQRVKEFFDKEIQVNEMLEGILKQVNEVIKDITG